MEKNLNSSNLEREKPQMNLSQVGNIVKEERQTLGISQAKLAEKSGVTQSAISRLETGKKVAAGVYDSVFEFLEIAIPITFPRQERK